MHGTPHSSLLAGQRLFHPDVATGEQGLAHLLVVESCRRDDDDGFGIRMRNEDITRLAKLLPLGVPVDIVA